MALPKITLEKKISFDEFKKQYADQFLYSHAPTREAKMKQVFDAEIARLTPPEPEKTVVVIEDKPAEVKVVDKPAK
jgi:hypothetical protein